MRQMEELRDLTERIIGLEREVRTMAESVAENMKHVTATLEAVTKPKGECSSGWIEVSDRDRLSARDLRTALLIGKVPETSGLLIDKKIMAQLLNVSSRTLSRLDDLQAIPAPIRLGGSMIRWRLAEILAWMDAGCPLRRTWTYPEVPVSKKR